MARSNESSSVILAEMKHNDDQCAFHSRRSGSEAIDIGIKGVSGRHLKRSRALIKGEVGMNPDILLYHNVLEVSQRVTKT